MNNAVGEQRPKAYGGSISLAPRERAFAALEVLVGSAVVIGHNIYRVLPNEVPILVIILWVSLLMRRKPWSSVGLSRPLSWTLTITVGICGGVLLQLKDAVAEPFARLIWHHHENVSSVLAGLHTHSPTLALRSLAIAWTFAAFGEELAYRALLLRRTADALNGSIAAYAAASVFSSVLFGLGHFFKGPSGIFAGTLSGIILAATYLITRRNLWAPVLAHGLSDTIALVFTYMAG